MVTCSHNSTATVGETLFGLAFVIAIITALVVWENHFMRLTPETMEYIKQHKCVRNGFAGRDAHPTFQCDNGVWLQREIIKKASV
jgi:hypothetical protein